MASSDALFNALDASSLPERRNVLRQNKKLDAARHTRTPRDEAATFERHDHLMHGRRTDFKVALHVGLGRCASIHANVGGDEGKVLPLLVRETGPCLLPSRANRTTGCLLQKLEPIAEWIADVE